MKGKTVVRALSLGGAKAWHPLLNEFTTTHPTQTKTSSTSVQKMQMFGEICVALSEINLVPASFKAEIL